MQGSGAAPAGGLAAPIRFLQGRTLVLFTVLSIALTGAGAALLLGRDDTERQPPAPAPGTPAEASVTDLRALAARADGPIYWAGTAPGTRFEVTRTRAGKVFVRYLPPDVEVGDKRARFLAVATYPFRRANAAAATASSRKGMVRASAPAGGLAVWSRSRPTSVYLSYPGLDLLVEVYSPKPAQARRLVLEGAVGPVDRKP